LLAVGLHTCTAVARSLCVSWSFLSLIVLQNSLPYLAKVKSPGSDPNHYQDLAHSELGQGTCLRKISSS